MRKKPIVQGSSNPKPNERPTMTPEEAIRRALNTPPMPHPQPAKHKKRKNGQ